ncbi:alpha/beta-hydrolase [Aureobasidium namibiae CBS 147.97]|uniref:Kynurenine formamidase n=1 Tax=Aureobasidium namibiae CBS 147.97 TaxID=1043004 RepID=A0A074WGJ7_9PEZI
MTEQISCFPSAEYHESSSARYWNDVPYGSTRLNLLDICVPKRQPEDASQAIWLVYIHGGAWRDPLIDRKSFKTALDMLLEDDQPHNIAGFVSVDYRLSPYPSHPILPSSPSDDSRNSQHPEHLDDILGALLFLSTEAGRYILCGHSCGATLAMQATALLNGGRRGTRPPVALLGMEGIYDLNALVAKHSHPAYREFITGAFGEDEGTWITASQLCCELQKWQGNALLIHSINDELVDMQQTDSAVEKLVIQGFTRTTAAPSSVKNDGRRVSKIVIDCMHDEVWEQGTELAKAIRSVTDESWIPNTSSATC